MGYSSGDRCIRRIYEHQRTVKGHTKEAAGSGGADKHLGAAKAIIASRGVED
jgi:hypothetical protein